MKRFAIRSTPATSTTITVVEADNETQALDFWADDKNIIKEDIEKHDDGFLEVDELE